MCLFFWFCLYCLLVSCITIASTLHLCFSLLNFFYIVLLRMFLVVAFVLLHILFIVVYYLIRFFAASCACLFIVYCGVLYYEFRVCYHYLILLLMHAPCSYFQCCFNCIAMFVFIPTYLFLIVLRYLFDVFFIVCSSFYLLFVLCLFH